MATGTLGHLKLHGHLEFDVEVCLVFYKYVSTSILDVDLENIRKTLVSANSTTALRCTTWEVMLILHGLCYKASLLSLFEIAPQQFSVTTLATKVILDQATLLSVESSFFFLTEMEFWRIRWFVGDVGTDEDNRTHKGNWFIDKVGITIILDMALVECIVRATTIKTLFHKLANFAHSPMLELRLHGCNDIFVGLHADNNLAMLLECLTFYIGVFCFNTAVLMWVGQLTLKSTTQILCYLALLIGEGPEQYLVRSFGLDAIAQTLLVVNSKDVVVKKSILTLSSHKLLICALVLKEKIVAAAAKYYTVSDKVIVHVVIALNQLPDGAYRYWNAQEACSFPDEMLCASMKFTENLINEGLSIVVVHPEDTWLQWKDIWFNYPPTTVSRHEDMPSFKGGEG